MSRVVLGVSGASGAALALAVSRHLNALKAEIDIVVSAAAERTLAEECGPNAFEELAAMGRLHDRNDIGASIASGSAPVDGMIVAPCSMRSLAAIANGLDDSLLTRAAGVQLKERRKLVVVPRETPLSLPQLKNMQAIHEAGAVVLPAAPGFYHGAATVDDLVNFVVARICDQMGVENDLIRRWGN